jgi:type II secretory pathway predicted ATPase ExeA
LTHPKPLTRYGLKYNPFAPDAPIDAFRPSSAVEHFVWRISRLVHDGGFALLTGQPGNGKSVALRILVDRLETLRDVSVGILTRPQSQLADFYRELGHLFGVELSPHNRWAGSRVLRARWREHIDTTLTRAVLVVDEAQEMPPAVLNELRLLAAAELDARSFLTVVLAGDHRLTEKFRLPELIPLGSRIRVRATLESLPPDELVQCLEHAITDAGNATLLTKTLMTTLAEHAAGNLRVLMTMASELFERASDENLDQLDDELYFRAFASAPPPPERKRAGRSR